MTARNSAVSQSRALLALQTEIRLLVLVRVARLRSRIVRRGVCCVCHVFLSLFIISLMTCVNGWLEEWRVMVEGMCRGLERVRESWLIRVLGMPGKQALEEAKQLFKLGGTRVEL
jgi:hypothetical protein